MLRYQDIAHKTSRLRALTSLEPDEFAALLPHFEHVFLEEENKKAVWVFYPRRLLIFEIV